MERKTPSINLCRCITEQVTQFCIWFFVKSFFIFRLIVMVTLLRATIKALLILRAALYEL